MSAIRIFILSALRERGPQHGHALRQLAQEEHVELWTDISVGGLYGALKRMETAGLVEIVRTEQEGNYPPRQVYAITEAGAAALEQDRAAAAVDRRLAPDPFDLVFTRCGPLPEQQWQQELSARLAGFREDLAAFDAHLEKVRRYLWLTELLSMEHQRMHLEAEIAWHEKVLGQLPEIVADQEVRQEHQGRKP
ncbi:PadR family transcriptional regulator [Dermacoccaceae bacterium W4C1]